MDRGVTAAAVRTLGRNHGLEGAGRLDHPPVERGTVHRQRARNEGEDQAPLIVAAVGRRQVDATFPEGKHVRHGALGGRQPRHVWMADVVGAIVARNDQ
jgi:hypothetical protein